MIYLNRGDLSKAALMYESLIKRHPDIGLGYYGLAVVCSYKREWKKAENLLKKALIRFPAMTEAQDLLNFVQKSTLPLK